MPRPLLLIGAFLTLALTGLGTAACASSQPASGMAGVAPMLSVERFLQAANTQDLDAMGRIFGTASGPMMEQTGNPLSCGFRRVGSWIGLSHRCLTRQDIELRMNAIALVLRHDDYQVRGESQVPGRRHPTTRIGVDLVRGSERFTDVPFVVVQGSGGRWMVEQVGLERITGRR